MDEFTATRPGLCMIRTDGVLTSMGMVLTSMGMVTSGMGDRMDDCAAKVKTGTAACATAYDGCSG